MSDRIGVALLNRLLHREAVDALCLRTVTNICDRNGNQILDYQKEHTRTVLEQYHFDPVTGKPTDSANVTKLQEITDETQSQTPGFWTKIDEYVAAYNASKQDGIYIQMTDEQKSAIENPDGKTVIVSLDDVGAKKQKSSRETPDSKVTHVQDESAEDLSVPPESKGRPSVETSVAHISVEGKRYVLVSDSMYQLCLSVLAFLLEFNLLGGYKLLFMSDGANNIRTSLETIFNFRGYTVLLDWFHLRKHCAEVISMVLRSGKENRATQYIVKRTLFRYLWCGNVSDAKTYIRGLSADIVRNEHRRNELIQYLERKEYAIQCYAVRRKLGLSVTSNPVEKANDLTVARRQKKKSMSWSTHGSRGLAALTALYMNNEDQNWTHTVSLSSQSLLLQHPPSSPAPTASSSSLSDISLFAVSFCISSSVRAKSYFFTTDKPSSMLATPLRSSTNASFLSSATLVSR